MYPVLIGEGMWAVPSYFTMVTLGFIVCFTLFHREAGRLGWDQTKIIDLCFVLVIASLLGARIAHVLFDGYLMDYVYLCIDPHHLSQPLPGGGACTDSSQCVAAQNQGYDIGAICQDGGCEPERSCLRPLMFWAGGLTYYGGFILAILSALYLSHRWHWSFIRLCDMASPMIALGLAFGRLGCFLAGCCFGKVTDVPWAIRFPKYSDAWRHHRELFPDELARQTQAIGESLSLPVHPTQLYELFGALAIFAFLWLWRKRSKYAGQSLALLLILYGVLRFVIEIFRDDARGGIWLSTSQWISLPLIALGIVLIIRGRRASSQATEPVSADNKNG